MSWRAALLVSAIGASMALAGCGGSDGAGSANSKATPSSTATPTTDASADRRIARESTLRLEDFPSGWTEADDPSNKVRCEGVEEVKKTTTARANSSRFREGENTQVQSTIYTFADEAAAEQGLTRLTARDTRVCYAEGITDALEAAGGLEVGDTRSARLSLDPLGDQRDAARVTVPVTTEEGVEADVVADLVFVRAGRGVSLGLFIDVLSAFDSDLREQLTATSVRRLSDNLASG